LNLTTTLRGERFRFGSLAEVLAKANEEKSGDQLAGIAARTERERVAAKIVLAGLTLGEVVDEPVIDPDDDEVSRLILDRLDARTFAPFRGMAMGEFREWILDDATTAEALADARGAITPEVAAGVAKLMSNKDLAVAAAGIRNVTRCRNTMGAAGVLGIRVQPNHPSDDVGGILLSAVDGLTYGCGDALIGVNPATESVDVVAEILRALGRLIDVLGAPTQACCLAHVTTQLACIDRGAPVDLLFQSVAGTQAANRGFGIDLALLREGRERVLEHHAARDVAWVGEQAMYFETGQGSALSAGAHHGVDQLTLEARAQAVARAFDPFLVNSVVGFIGPEYLFDERQIIRAGLEDHFVGKLQGLPMGVDVCYTNHAAADQNSADNLLLLLTAAGCNFFMGVPCSDDVMLNYQTTSYHDALAVRDLFRLRPAPEFEAWLAGRGLGRGASPIDNDRARDSALRALESVLSESGTRP
jgi:ethanolamine ammonia-lyase large subunit